MKLCGKAWRFGDGLGATDLVSSDHDALGMSHDWDGCAPHLLERVAPDFTRKMKPGDILVTGRGLGSGHAHYYMTAIMACKHAGLAGILCEDVNTLFQRAAIDQGYAIWALPGITGFVGDGDELEVDLATGEAHNRSAGTTRLFPPVPQLILDILEAGSGLEWALRRAAA